MSTPGNKTFAKDVAKHLDRRRMRRRLAVWTGLIGAMDAGFPVLIADADGERLTPSVVHFPHSGEPIVGRAAARLRAIEPDATIYSAKRFIGHRVGEVPADVSYALAGAPGTPVKFRVRERDVSPEEVAALILRKLKADAERALGGEVSRAVITVPAYFNDAQRQATKDAGRMAGLEVLRLVNEPTAAALAHRMGKGSRVMAREQVRGWSLASGFMVRGFRTPPPTAPASSL